MIAVAATGCASTRTRALPALDVPDRIEMIDSEVKDEDGFHVPIATISDPIQACRIVASFAEGSSDWKLYQSFASGLPIPRFRVWMYKDGEPIFCTWICSDQLLTKIPRDGEIHCKDVTDAEIARLFTLFGLNPTDHLPNPEAQP